MTDLGSLNYFLGISAQRSSTGLFLSQSKYAEEILERAHMQKCNPCRTPVDTESKLGLTVILLSYMHDPREPHLAALKRILRYVRETVDHGLQLHVTLSRSSAEAKYRGVANVVAETAWVRNLLRELHAPLFTATLVYCDNVSAVYLSTNPV
ncbi:ribonuclease H-like domain-containing protein [Tanacetum coccineum]